MKRVFRPRGQPSPFSQWAMPQIEREVVRETVDAWFVKCEGDVEVEMPKYAWEAVPSAASTRKPK